MRETTVWRGLLGVEHTVIERVEFEQERVVAHVRPTARQCGRCGLCRRRCPAYDAGAGRRRWRTLDSGTCKVFLEADAPRVFCRSHGVTVAAVPWARHGAGHTRVFDQQVAWLATQTSKSAATELMRIAWRTVGAIITRVWDEVEAEHDRLASVTRIGIDEISYKRGHKYLTVVVDHDSGRLLWAAPGKDRATLNRFFEALEASGPGRCAQITHVSADGADWIEDVVATRCPNAVRCADPFHIVKWATDALDAVRRAAWNQARRGGHTKPDGHANGTASRTSKGLAEKLKHSRMALWKNPDNLTERQQIKLEWIAKNDPRLYQGYLLKEGLRLVLQLPTHDAPHALDTWLSWAHDSGIPEFVTLHKRVLRQRPKILAAIEHGLSNGRIESVNTKIRLITRIAFGFASPQALIALAMLNLGGHKPTLPGRK